jgi:hypothetical protein
MNELSEISSEFAQSVYAAGSTQVNAKRVGLYIAPRVPVPTHFGTYKKWSDKNRFCIPGTERGLGGHATVIEADAMDGTYDATPRALDYAVERAVGEAEVPLLLKDGASIVFDIAELDHERRTIQAALEGAGAGTAKVWNSSADPVDEIDTEIKALMLATRCADIKILFGVTAWQIFKNHPKVTARCKGDLSYASCPNLFHNGSEFRAAYAMADQNPEGLVESIDFILDDEALIFTCSPNPNRRDPSFMKSFGVISDRLGAKIWTRKDGRVDFVAYDWSEDVRVTNTAGVVRLNIASA